MAEYELWESYWMLQNIQNNRKIKSSNKKRVLSTGTPGSILMLFLFHTKKKTNKKRKWRLRNHASVFQHECITSSTFFQTYCLSLLCLHLPSTKCWISALPAAFSSMTWFTKEFFSFVLITTPPYVFSIPGAPTLVFSLPISAVTEGNSHYIKASLQKPGWNNPLK